jgi:hypothetical protein
VRRWIVVDADMQIAYVRTGRGVPAVPVPIGHGGRDLIRSPRLFAITRGRAHRL